MNRSSLYQHKPFKQSSFKRFKAKPKSRQSKKEYEEQLSSNICSNNDPSQVSSVKLKSELESFHEKIEVRSGSKQSQNEESEMEMIKNQNQKSKKIKFLTEQQKHVLVGVIGIAIIIGLSYAMLNLLALIKQ